MYREYTTRNITNAPYGSVSCSRCPLPGVGSQPGRDSFLTLLTSDIFCRVVTCMLCVAGLSWQIYVVISQYMEFGIVSEVMKLKPLALIPPAFSLCLPYPESINWSQHEGWEDMTPSTWISLRSDHRERLTMNMQNNWTIGQISERTYDFKYYKLSGWVRRLNSYEVARRDEYMVAKKYIRDDLVCNRIYHADVERLARGKFYYQSHHVSYGEEPGGLLSFSMDKSKLQQVTKASIFLHGNHAYPRGDADFPLNFISTNGSTVFDNGSSYYGLTYEKVILTLLPSPYPTNCMDYTYGRFESHQHCIDHCMRIKVLKEFNESSFMTTFANLQNYRIMSKYSVILSRSKENKVDLIYDACKEECPSVDCLQHRYLPQLMSTRDSIDVTFQLYQPNGPDTQIIFHPKMTTMELYVQVMSVCGVWLGISLVDVVIHMVEFILKGGLQNKRRRSDNGKSRDGQRAVRRALNPYQKMQRRMGLPVYTFPGSFFFFS